MNIIEAMSDEQLFEPWFQGPSWNAWRCVLRAAFALPMDPSERETFRSLAQRDPPSRRVREVWVVAGRRCGKDSIASLIAAHVAAFFDADAARLRRGERAAVLALAVDKEQASIVHRYIRSYFTEIELLRGMVTRETQFGLELSNGVDITIGTADYRHVRGKPILCAVLDECAFWRGENSALPDTETYGALKPGTMTLPDSMLIGITTPHKRSGLAYDVWSASFGRDSDDVLVIQAPSIALNPLLDEAAIAAEILRDPELGKSEWQACWRDDLSSFVDRLTVERAVDVGVVSRDPAPRHGYQAFIDPAGGAGQDAFAMSIAHAEGDIVLVDHLTEVRPAFSPETVVAQMAETLRRYGVREIRSDRFAGTWPRESFARHGIDLVFHDRDRSQIYCDFLPLLTSGRVRLLDDRRLIGQLCGLERSTRAARADRIDHARNAHDDAINAAAGACTVVASLARYQAPTAKFANWDDMRPLENRKELRDGNVAWQSAPCTIRLEEPKRPINDRAPTAGFGAGATWS